MPWTVSVEHVARACGVHRCGLRHGADGCSPLDEDSAPVLGVGERGWKQPTPGEQQRGFYRERVAAGVDPNDRAPVNVRKLLEPDGICQGVRQATVSEPATDSGVGKTHQRLFSYRILGYLNDVSIHVLLIGTIVPGGCCPCHEMRLSAIPAFVEVTRLDAGLREVAAAQRVRCGSCAT